MTMHVGMSVPVAVSMSVSVSVSVSVAMSMSVPVAMSVSAAHSSAFTMLVGPMSLTGGVQVQGLRVTSLHRDHKIADLAGGG